MQTKFFKDKALYMNDIGTLDRLVSYNNNLEKVSGAFDINLNK